MILSLPLVYCGEPRFRLDPSRERAWVLDTEPTLIPESDASEAPLVCRLHYPDLEDVQIDWRLVEGRIMRPVLDMYWPMSTDDLESGENLGPYDDPNDDPARQDHPSAVRLLTPTWPETRQPFAVPADAFEAQGQFRRWRWNDRDSRRRLLLDRVREYRIVGTQVFKPAHPPTWAVIPGDPVIVSICPFEWIDAAHRAAFHFHYDDRDRGFEFAAYLARRLRTEAVAEDHGRFERHAGGPDTSDHPTSMAVAVRLAAELAGRAAWRMSPAMAAIFSELRLAYEGDNRELAAACRRFEALPQEDLNSPGLRSLQEDLRTRRSLLGDVDDLDTFLDLAL